MSFRWLKSYMPRSLYGRAFLILLLPVVTLMLVVSVLSVQRIFEGVTGQMTTAVSREIRLLLESDLPVEELAKSRVAQTLNIGVEALPAEDVPDEDVWQWYDLTGGSVVRAFSRLLPGIRAVELPDNRIVRLYFDRGEEGLRLTLDRRRVSAVNPHQILVNMAVFALIMTVIAFLYLRNQLRPITRLAHAAEAFGRGRHVDYRPAGAIEVRAAGQAFLEMRARIERQIEQRTLMLSGISHDLRTPLTRLKLGLAMLKEEERVPLQRDVEDMERLIDEFLDFVRGAQQGEPEEVDPVALVQRVVEDARRAGRAVALVRVAGEGRALLHEQAIRRAIENLIGNAVRYGKRAELSVVFGERQFCIAVEDDGPGIPTGQREEAVKPFVRLDTARNQNLGTGVGLGLSIAADIARAHGGMLRLGRSERLGGVKAELVIGR